MLESHSTDYRITLGEFIVIIHCEETQGVTDMTQTTSTKAGLNALLTPQESVLILIDHQPFQFANLHSHEPMMVVNNVIGLGKAAKVFNVPTILTTVLEDRGGKLIKGLQEVFPDQKPIDRTWINAWEDTRVVDAVKKTGRKKLVIAALWTEICLAMPAIQAAGEGFEVYAVTDASGGVSVEAHEMGVRRMMMAGVVPMNWLAVAGEWQRDWARQDSAKALGESVLPHTGGTGTAFAWELQLLGQAAGAGA
jgi:nicotinamidase-related amidase